MWDIEKGKSNLVFEVVRKDSYATVSKMVDEVRIPGLVIAVHDSRYLRKIIRTDSIETKVIYEDKTEVIDPRVLRDKTVMVMQEFLAGHEEGVMLVDILEELGKRLSIPEMEKTVKTLASFKSCKHTILATLNPVVLPKDMVKAITPMFDSVQDVRAASMGGEHVDCPNCGAQWDSLVTICSMCGYNLKTHTIRVSTSSRDMTIPQKQESGDAPQTPEHKQELQAEKVEPVAKEYIHSDKNPVSKPEPAKKARDMDPGEEILMEAFAPTEQEANSEARSSAKKAGREEFLENLTFKFISTETGPPEKKEDPPMPHTVDTSGRRVDWFSRGVSLELKGDSRGALDAYEKALEVSPNDPWIWLNKGVSLQRLGRLQEALDCYDEAIKLDPTDPDSWSNRATALRGLGRLEEAVESYKRALEISPDDGGIWSNLGIALRSMGHFEEALTSYESALELTPNDLSIWLNKAAVLSSLYRYEESMACYDRILEMDPGNTGVKELKKYLARRMRV